MNRGVKMTMVSLAALLSAGVAMGASVSFDLRPTRKLMKAAAAPTGEPTGILRTTSLAAGKTLTDPLAVGDELSFALFDDVTVTLSLAERTEAPLGGETFLAEVSGYDGMKNAVVVQTSDGLQVDVQDFRKNRVYSIVSTAKGTSVREFDPQAGKVVPTKPLVPELSKTDSPVMTQSSVMASPSTDQASTLVDVLVAFDRNAVTYANQNEGGIDNFANMAVAKMNTALANNGMSSLFRFRLVGTMSVDASATDVHTGLYAIRDSEAGWAAIKTKREKVGADIVTTLIDTGSAYGTTGVGWSLMDTSSISSFADNAYNVCAIRSVAQSHTMTHETGHNMGAGHATAVADAGNRGPQLYGYSSGYYFTGSDGKAYHTIMAYNSDGYGNSYTEAPLFSSPNCSWAGVAAGDATHDNAQTIKNTYQYASAWRAQKIAMSYDVFFSPETRATFSESITVTLTPGKAGLPIRYTVDGSMPTLSSPLYSAPLVFTATTTIKAATVTDGVLGPVYEATYLKSDLGMALNAPQLVWTTSSDYPWATQTDNTFDGFAVQSCPQFVGTFGLGKTSWLKTTVTGPTEMGFRYQKRQYSSSFKVYCDNQVVWSDSEGDSGIGTSFAWNAALVNLPAGTHEIKFAFEQGYGYYGNFNGIVLDTVCFDAWSVPPTISPATTASQSTAKTFTGSMTITLTPPQGRTGTLFYTLDGSDPTQEGALPYTGPFTVDKSVFVQAVFVEPGREASPPAQGYFLERHPVKPGEWTTDVEGAKAAAAEDGKLIAVLCANRRGCGWTQRLMPIAESAEFLAWAEANGVYLITSDDSELIDTEAAEDYFWSLWGGGSVNYPTLVFARPSAPDKLLSWGRARNDGDSTIGGMLYKDTVESLVHGFAAVMGQTSVLSAPTVSPDVELINSFPLTVTLANPNVTGTIYYTLDGSVPTKTNGKQYTSSISIASSDVVLKAAVWNASGLSSPVLVKSYRSISEWANGIFGTSGITWQRDGTVDWTKASEDRTLRTGGLLSGSSYVSTLKATVTGKGKFVFTYRGCTWGNQNSVTYSLNGITQRTISGYCTSGAQGETVTKVIDTAGTTTFTWTYTVAEPSCDYTSGYNYNGAKIWSGVWLSDVQWIPEGSAVFPSVGDLATVFGSDSDVAKNITTAEELAKVNEFAASVGLTSVANLTTAQKAHFYESYVLSAVMKSPTLLTAEPKLEISSFGANAVNAANWDLSVSLSAGNQNLEMIASELRKMIRVGTDVRNVNGAATVLATPSGDGATVTLTIQKPGTAAGFVRVVVDK